MRLLTRSTCVSTGISGTPKQKSITIDAYGYWTDAAYTTVNGLYAVKSTADLGSSFEARKRESRAVAVARTERRHRLRYSAAVGDGGGAEA